MNRGTEILSASSYFSAGSTLFFEGKKETIWTLEENKRFEDALALYDKETPDRWHNVAQMIPGKSVNDVINHYRKLEEDINEIEAGMLVIDGYSSDTVTLEWVANNHSQLYSPGGKRCASNRVPDHEKKKGIPWTEEEHRQFLLGLKKYGKGDWRNISRNFVTTRTPTQVASHAQKYFIRQLSGGKDKRRSSIHDITTVHLNDTRKNTHLEGDDSCPRSDECTLMITPPLKPPHHHHHMAKALYHWTLPAQQQVTTNMAFNLPNSSLMMAPLHGNSTYGPQYGHFGTVFQGNC